MHVCVCARVHACMRACVRITNVFCVCLCAWCLYVWGCTCAPLLLPLATVDSLVGVCAALQRDHVSYVPVVRRVQLVHHLRGILQQLPMGWGRGWGRGRWGSGGGEQSSRADDQIQKPCAQATRAVLLVFLLSSLFLSFPSRLPPPPSPLPLPSFSPPSVPPAKTGQHKAP